MGVAAGDVILLDHFVFVVIDQMDVPRDKRAAIPRERSAAIMRTATSRQLPLFKASVCTGS
jgi:hypothetical protein